MTEMERQILNALEGNQHRGGLTGAEIRKVLGLRIVDENEMRDAKSNLLKKNLIQCQDHPTNKYIKVYSLCNQNLQLHCVAIKPKTQPINREFKAIINHPLFHESKLQEILEDALNGWIYIADISSLPCCSGVYAFYGDKGRICLYVGQSLNLKRRIYESSTWRQAKQEFDKPSVAYKIIEHKDINKTKCELIYEESLLIGLLRPKWNIVVPRHRHKVVTEQYELE